MPLSGLNGGVSHTWVKTQFYHWVCFVIMGMPFHLSGGQFPCQWLEDDSSYIMDLFWRPQWVGAQQAINEWPWCLYLVCISSATHSVRGEGAGWRRNWIFKGSDWSALSRKKQDIIMKSCASDCYPPPCPPKEFPRHSEGFLGGKSLQFICPLGREHFWTAHPSVWMCLHLACFSQRLEFFGSHWLLHQNYSVQFYLFPASSLSL